jgi:hypothetical protein
MDAKRFFMLEIILPFFIVRLPVILLNNDDVNMRDNDVNFL